MEQTATVGIRDWYRGFIQGKTRIVFAWLFSILLVFSAREAPTWPGVALCFVGATLRFWASGYLMKDTRIAIGGPYAYTRNPLYLGTYLMAVGIALAIENTWLFILTSVAFAAVYHYIILDEETKLKRIFGEPFERYLLAVPRFWPRILPRVSEKSRAQLLAIDPHLNENRFHWAVANKNKAYEAYAAFAALVGFVWLVSLAWRWVR